MNMLAVWNPFVPVKRTQRRSIFDSLFDDSLFENVFTTFGVHQAKNEDGSISMAVDLPGMKEDDINIYLDDNVVTIKGERKTLNSTYTVDKSFTLPENCDTENLKAELKNGVLTLTLAMKPLPAAPEPKKIPITTSK
jgi:HSP20 family protein